MGCALCLRIPSVALRAPLAADSPARVPLRFLALLGVVCCLGAVPVWASGAAGGSVAGQASAIGGGTYSYQFTFALDWQPFGTAVWRLPVRDPQDISGIWAPLATESAPAWQWTTFARPSGGWDPSVWNPIEALRYAEDGALDLADPPFLLAFSGPTSTVPQSGGFGFLSDLESVGAPGNATVVSGMGQPTRYFDPPTPNGPILTPEPGCVGLLGLAGCIGLLRRRRHA